LFIVYKYYYSLHSLLSLPIFYYTLGLFETNKEIIIDWHTGDYSMDNIYPNSGICPELNALQHKASSSPAFIAWNTSQSNIKLTQTLDSIFGKGFWSQDDILDCLMTTVCSTHYEIPDGPGPEVNNPNPDMC
jgi:hypothetical protein